MSDPRKFLRFIVASILALFLCAVPAFSQGVRFTPSPITTTATVSGTPNVYVAVTASTIAFCSAPASGVPCVNKATTYTDATLATPCALSTQVVLDGTSSCVAAPDSLGNWGIFAPPGQYAYTITTSVGASFGPFYVTLSLPAVVQNSYNTNSATAPTTLTAANISGGLIDATLNLNGALVAGANATLPTVANLVAAIPGARIGQTYRLRIINSSSGAFTWTVLTNTGWTLNGTMTVAQNTWRDFNVTLTSLTAATLQSIGTGTFS